MNRNTSIALSFTFTVSIRYAMPPPSKSGSESIYLRTIISAMRRRDHHNVYVVELAPEVLGHAKFRRANPGYEAEGRRPEGGWPALWPCARSR